MFVDVCIFCLFEEKSGTMRVFNECFIHSIERQAVDSDIVCKKIQVKRALIVSGGEPLPFTNSCMILKTDGDYVGLQE